MATLTELLIALVVAWIYLTIVRFVDVNEREPLWALTTAFACGLLAAGLARVLIDPGARLTTLWGPVGEEALKLPRSSRRSPSLPVSRVGRLVRNQRSH